MPNNRAAIYILLVVCGTLLSGWGWWVTNSILEAASARTQTITEWSVWRGQITEKLDSVHKDLLLTRQELEQIKVYLRTRGWKPATSYHDKPAAAPTQALPKAAAAG